MSIDLEKENTLLLMNKVFVLFFIIQSLNHSINDLYIYLQTIIIVLYQILSKS